jgi:hypothetical protein
MVPNGECRSPFWFDPPIFKFTSAFPKNTVTDRQIFKFAREPSVVVTSEFRLEHVSPPGTYLAPGPTSSSHARILETMESATAEPEPTTNVA